MLQYEHFVLHEELGKKISSPQVQSGGCINFPDAPGLGVEQTNQPFVSVPRLQASVISRVRKENF